MLSMTIKVLLGIFAFIVSVLGVSDVKSLKQPPADGSPSRFGLRRLTKWGVVKIACAVATLALLAANEFLTYNKQAADAIITAENEKQLKLQLAEAAQKQDEARTALGLNILEIARLSRNNEYLVRSLDRSMQRVGTIRVNAQKIGDTDLDLELLDGSKFKPKRGDILDWTFVCRNGAFPPLPVTSNSTCRAIGYGRLIANGFAIPLVAASGKNTFFGTRSIGGTGILSYRSSAEEPSCAATSASLKDSMCDLEITVLSEARWNYQNPNSFSAPKDAIESAQDACRRYEALYNVSCEDAIKRAHK